MDIDYNGFLNEILQLVTNLGNAVVRVIRGGGEPLITIGVLEGRIVTVTCGPSRGLPALPRIREMVRGTLHVQHVKPRSMDPDLPGTDEVLSALGCSGVGVTPISATSVSAQGIGKALILNELPPLLSDYIGPMADFVCDDDLSTLKDQLSSAEVRQLITLLAANVKDPTKCQSFQTEAQQALLGSDR